MFNQKNKINRTLLRGGIPVVEVGIPMKERLSIMDLTTFDSELPRQESCRLSTKGDGVFLWRTGYCRPQQARTIHGQKHRGVRLVWIKHLKSDLIYIFIFIIFTQSTLLHSSSQITLLLCLLCEHIHINKHSPPCLFRFACMVLGLTVGTRS